MFRKAGGFVSAVEKQLSCHSVGESTDHEVFQFEVSEKQKKYYSTTFDGV